MKVDKASKRELLSLIAGMDVPDYRRKLESNHDVCWLNKNLGARNSSHRNFAKAMELIKKML